MPNNRRNWKFKEIVKILEENNFRLIHIKGSHHIYHGNICGQMKMVCVPKHKTIDVGTMGCIIKQSGIDKNLWM